MQDMWTISSNLVTGNQDHSFGIQSGMINRAGVDVVVADHQEIVAASGEVVNDGLGRALAVAVVGPCASVIRCHKSNFLSVVSSVVLGAE